MKIQQWWLWSVMTFLFDKIKIQVLGLFILTSALVTFKNLWKQKRSILDDVFWNHRTFLWAGYKKERESNWDPIEDHRKDNPSKGNNYPKDSSLLRKASLCIGCSFSFNGTPRTLGKWKIVEPIWRSWQNLTKWEQFTGHKLLFMVFNLIPDVWETLSQLL